MPTYNFSNITAAQALAISGADTLVLDLASGQSTRVLFSADTDQITIVAGGRTVAFGPGVAGAAKSYPGGGSLFVGGSGDDQKALDAGSDGLFGGEGADSLAGGAGDDVLQGNQGGDSLNGGAGRDVVYGGRDNDVIDTGAQDSSSDFAQGNLGDDTVVGSATGDDVLIGGQGNDLINAFAVSGADGAYEPISGRIGTGSDVLNGNRGDDKIFAGFGDDRILGEDGADYLFDYGGQDTIDGGVGDDTIIDVEAIHAVIGGGAGNDIIIAAGAGAIDADAGDDAVALFVTEDGPNRFEVRLGDGDDICFVTSNVSNPTGGFTVDGGAGNDVINTSDGSDSVNGGAGADTIDGWAGADTVAGGAGTDTFQFFSGEALTKLVSLDHILDWSSEDRIYFADSDTGEAIGTADATNFVAATRTDYAAALSFANMQVAGGSIDYVVVQVGGDVFVFCDSYYDAGFADSAVKLVGRTLADISAVNFTDVGE